MAFEIVDDVLFRYSNDEGETEVVIPDNVKKISDNAFGGCSNMYL